MQYESFEIRYWVVIVDNGLAHEEDGVLEEGMGLDVEKGNIGFYSFLFKVLVALLGI